MARVLVVEEEPSIARIIEFKLAREGFQVTVVETPGRVAEAPDLIVTEVAHVDGCQLCYPGVPRLVLYEARTESARGGVPVPKPFKPTVLARMVREVIG